MISCRETLSVFSGASGRLDAIQFADEELTTEAQGHGENLNRGNPKTRLSLSLCDSVVKKLFSASCFCEIDTGLWSLYAELYGSENQA